MNSLSRKLRRRILASSVGAAADLEPLLRAIV
jgi:hypothetical protein